MMPVVLAAAFGIWGAMPVSAAARLPEGLSVGGRSLSGLTLEEAKAELERAVDSVSAQKITLDIQGEQVSTTAGELGLFWSNADAVEETAARYENSSLVKRYMMTEDFGREPVDIPFETEVKEELVQAFVEASCDGLGEPGQDASIVRENGEFQITPEVIGTEVDLEATAAALNDALKGELTEKIAVTASIKDSQPKITAKDLETIQDVLGTFSTDFSSSGAARSTNLKVGAGKLNGHVLMPGETLSGYEYLHPFTEENGYKTAAAYENGQVVDSIGGGVCQIATTLYNASILAELEITQRQNHSMIVGYVKPSMDAAIAGTYKDIKVTNNWDTPIYVEGYTEGRTLTFTIYGKETRPDNRELRFESETLSVTEPGAPTEVLNPALAPGSRVQVQSAHRGLKSQLWKIVTVDGKEVERTLLSKDTYNASPAVVQVGPPAPEVIPAAPEETAPAAGSDGTGAENAGAGGTDDGAAGQTPADGGDGTGVENAGGDGGMTVPAGPGGSEPGTAQPEAPAEQPQPEAPAAQSQLETQAAQPQIPADQPAGPG
ncbi:MAG: VanW family protein, partial [Lachnospiraceae bacterium]|nr:VanW family protein [Lachnospiraceae bacterium]